MIIFVFSALSLASRALSSENVDFLSKVRVAGGPELGANLVLASVPLSLESFASGQPAETRGQELALQYSSSKAIYGLSALVAAERTVSLTEQPINSSILIHEVRSGDTVLSLAEQFAISKETIVNANRLQNTELTSGQKIIILPVSGVLHEVTSGEDVFSLADSYGVSAARISLANGLSEVEQLVYGEKLIIPGAAEKAELSLTNTQLKPVNSVFRMPTLGWNWGKLHNDAVDIANDCGTPVYASARGRVKELAYDGLYHGGLGNYITLDHGAGKETLYAHLSAVFVSVGDSANEGDLIGAIGKTGNVTGASGCHLHFGVYGVPNPFAK